MRNIKCIIGLGNNGNQYINTRHNIGKDFINWIINFENLNFKISNKFNKADLIINDKKILLVTTNLYMNESGKIIPDIINYFESPEQIVVIYDDMQIKFGSCSFRENKDRGERGHNGLRSINSFVKKDNLVPYYFGIGIGRPPENKEVGDFVLEKFTKNEQEHMNELFFEFYKKLKLNL